MSPTRHSGSVYPPDMTHPQYGLRPVSAIPPVAPAPAFAVYPHNMAPQAPLGGFGQPPAPFAAPQFLVLLGDIGVTAVDIRTPSGIFPLADVTVYAMDQTRVIRKTPGWAIVVAILGALFFLLGLFFLLVKEEVVTGYIAITVEGQGRRHVSQVPVASAGARVSVMQRVGYVQNLTANARAAMYR